MNIKIGLMAKVVLASVCFFVLCKFYNVFADPPVNSGIYQIGKIDSVVDEGQQPNYKALIRDLLRIYGKKLDSGQRVADLFHAQVLSIDEERFELKRIAQSLGCIENLFNPVVKGFSLYDYAFLYCGHEVAHQLCTNFFRGDSRSTELKTTGLDYQKSNYNTDLLYRLLRLYGKDIDVDRRVVDLPGVRKYPFIRIINGLRYIAESLKCRENLFCPVAEGEFSLYDYALLYCGDRAAHHLLGFFQDLSYMGSSYEGLNIRIKKNSLSRISHISTPLTKSVGTSDSTDCDFSKVPTRRRVCDDKTIEGTANVSELDFFEQYDTACCAKLSSETKIPKSVFRHEPGNTVLHRVVKYNSAEFIRELIMAGADPNVQDSMGNTPLHIACEYQYNSVIDVLLENNARRNVENDEGYVPLMIWLKMGSLRKEYFYKLIPEDYATNLDKYKKKFKDVASEYRTLDVVAYLEPLEKFSRQITRKIGAELVSKYPFETNVSDKKDVPNVVTIPDEIPKNSHTGADVADEGKVGSGVIRTDKITDGSTLDDVQRISTEQNDMPAWSPGANSLVAYIPEPCHTEPVSSVPLECSENYAALNPTGAVDTVIDDAQFEGENSMFDLCIDRDDFRLDDEFFSNSAFNSSGDFLNFGLDNCDENFLGPPCEKQWRK